MTVFVLLLAFGFVGKGAFVIVFIFIYATWLHANHLFNK